MNQTFLPVANLRFVAVISLVYALIYSSVNGIFIDEMVVAAQIIAGDIVYPAGHPHDVFYKKAFSLFNYLAAAIWMIWKSPEALSLGRNILMSFLSVFFPFSIIVLLTRKISAGVIATVFLFLNVTKSLEGVYPVSSFPGLSGISHGGIGAGVGLLAVVLFISDRRCKAGLLTGLMPAIHPAIALIVWAWTAVVLFVERKSTSRSAFEAYAKSFVVGLAVCSAFALVFFAITSNSAESASPYNVTVDSSDARDNFMRFSDSHRRGVSFLTAPYTVGPAAFFILFSLLLQLFRDDKARLIQVRRLLIFCGLCWLIVYGDMILSFLPVPRPDFLWALMPMRFASLAVIFLIPLSLTVIVKLAEEFSPFTKRMIAAYLLIAISCFIVLIRNKSLVGSWGDSSALTLALFGFIWGVALGIAVYSKKVYEGNKRRVYLAAFLLLAIMLIFAETPFCGLAFALGFIFTPALLKIPKSKGLAANATLQMSGNVIALALAILTITTIPVIPRKDVLQNVRQWLHTNVAENEMILPFIYPLFVAQTKIDHPILMKSETLLHMSYMPRLASAVSMMVKDVYEIDYSNVSALQGIAVNGKIAVGSSIWMDSWLVRSRDEWKRLSGKYSFRYVMAPAKKELDLDVVFANGSINIYQIAQSDEATDSGEIDSRNYVE